MEAGDIADGLSTIVAGDVGFSTSKALRAAFKSCPVDTALVGWTPLGHYELQRKRERLPLEEVLK